jgi:hypothetical protein
MTDSQVKLVFCTLFDSAYLSRGLVMYESLRRNAPGFHLYIFAFDEICYDIIRSLNLESITLIALKDLENDQLLEAKKDRSKAEYCWTCTPSTIAYVIEKFNEPLCTYIDADLFFYSDPGVLLDELRGNKSVLITEHGYSFVSGIFEKKKAGRFCVQFISFKNEIQSTRILHKWRGQCIDWCYARYEDRRFGDQKYLDEWPDLYENVHILEHQGAGVAPWNTQKFCFTYEKPGLIKKRFNSGIFPVVFFHYHYVRFLSEGQVDIGWNLITKKVLKIFYIPYIKLLLEKELFLKSNFTSYRQIFRQNEFNGFKGQLKKILKKNFNFNIVTV